MCCGRSETFILQNKKKILVSMLVLLVMLFVLGYLFLLEHQSWSFFYFLSIIIHDWKSFHIYFLGEISWSIWSQTYYSDWDILSVSFYFVPQSKDVFFLFSCRFFITRFPTLFRIIFNTLFGLSTSFWLAISVRFLLGCFNCLLGVIRVTFSPVE